MTRHFCKILSNNSGIHSTISEIEKFANKFGYVVDYKKFSDNEFMVMAEVGSGRVEPFFNSLKKQYPALEELNSVFLKRDTDDEVIINISFPTL